VPAVPAEVPVAFHVTVTVIGGLPKAAPGRSVSTKVEAVVAAPHSDRLTSVPTRRVLARRWNLSVRRFREAEIGWLLFLGALALLFGILIGRQVPALTVSSLTIPMVIGNIVLGPKTLPWFVVYCLSVGVIVVALSPNSELDSRRVGGIVVSFLVGLIILVSSFRRSQLGVAGGRGESMLVDLRDRINKQGVIPALPADWYAESVMRSAGGSSFSGDFIAASRSSDGRRLEVAVVDVSGKGEQAGTRSLLLSGAFGGLLGAMQPDEFLPAANEYLLRQQWTEGFATAVHLSLDLSTGHFELRSAGHPPAVQLHAGSGRWGVHEAEGPILGLLGDAHFTVVRGTLKRGDALLLFTDGLVETASRDISLGIDKLLGMSEQLLRNGFERGAKKLIDRVESTNDDRALLLLHRR
jgi:hypothetical protein